MIEIEQLADPERKLWANVLLQAVTDLSGRDLAARSARAWFASADNTVGSFIWVCHQMALEPDAVRQRLLRDAKMKTCDTIRNHASETYRAA